MMNKQMNKLSAPQLRLILIGFIILLFGLSAVGFWFFRQQLVTYADTVSIANAAASSSSDDISKLQKLKVELSNDKVAVTRAKNIVADSQHYQYQDQIITDINAYAKAAGISVTGFTFNNEAGSGTAVAAATAPPTSTAVVPAGLKVTSAIITIENPVSYQSILNFFHSIELNLTKMNIVSISLSKSPTDNTITVNPISIEVYTR